MLPQALKLKVIQQYEAGKLQKDIAHDLGISTGSVSGILKASREDKQKHEDNINSSPQEQPKQPIAFEDSRVVARDQILEPEEARPIPDSDLQYLEIQNVT
jgi:transcriptional regulator